MARYAKRLTKEDLMRGGIIGITENGLVYSKNGLIKLHVNNNGYYIFTIYEFDKDGNKIKVPIKRTYKNKTKETDTYIYKTRTIPLHRAMWAWYNEEVPEGMVVDHINNKHTNLKEDYRLSNLQLLTPPENVTKNRECNTKLIPCKLDRPRSYYEEKLKKYEDLYQDAKEAKEASKAHKLRINITQTRARLRFWDKHRKEIESIMSNKREYTEKELIRLEERRESLRDLKELRYWKRVFREQGNKAMWKECIKVEKLWKDLPPIVRTNSMETLRNFVRRP